MKHSQKAKYIICSCMLAVGIFSAVILYQSFRPFETIPYEEATWEQVQEYMAFETGYALVDVSEPEQFAENHLPEAVNIPYSRLLNEAAVQLQDKARTIYLYGTDKVEADKAARKLCEAGYTGVTLITEGAGGS